MNNSPIGIFDSGVGGLTVVRELIKRLPEESFIYFGDTAHIPYGNKTKEQLFTYAHKIISYFLQRRVKAIIVACGTHSSVTLPTLKYEYPIPILGVVKPGARSAVGATRNGRIGVLATQATVNSKAYQREIEILDPGLKVFQAACARFVPLIEAGELKGEQVRSAVNDYVAPLLHEKIDTLVLGCTHYPFLRPIINDVAANVRLVDPADETVSEIADLMKDSNIGAVNPNPTHEFLVSGNNNSFYQVGRLLLGDVIQEVGIYNMDTYQEE